MSCSLSETHRCAECDSDIADAIAEGRRLERAAIVADLRAQLTTFKEPMLMPERAAAAVLRAAVNRYEQDRHIKETT